MDQTCHTRVFGLWWIKQIIMIYICWVFYSISSCKKELSELLEMSKTQGFILRTREYIHRVVFKCHWIPSDRIINVKMFILLFLWTYKWLNLRASTYFKLTWLTLFFSSFLDLYIASDIRGIRSTRIYRKREDFHFKIRNIPRLSSTLPPSSAYIS